MAQNCSHVTHLSTTVSSTCALFGWTAACQLTAFWSATFEWEAPGHERKNTHGDSGAALKPPPNAKLTLLPCFPRSAAPTIRPYGRPSTTRTSTLRTGSSVLKTSGSSHDSGFFSPGAVLLVGLAAVNHPCPLRIIIDGPSFRCAQLNVRMPQRIYITVPCVNQHFYWNATTSPGVMLHERTHPHLLSSRTYGHHVV